MSDAAGTVCFLIVLGGGVGNTDNPSPDPNEDWVRDRFTYNTVFQLMRSSFGEDPLEHRDSDSPLPALSAAPSANRLLLSISAFASLILSCRARSMRSSAASCFFNFILASTYLSFTAAFFMLW